MSLQWALTRRASADWHVPRTVYSRLAFVVNHGAWCRAGGPSTEEVTHVMGGSGGKGRHMLSLSVAWPSCLTGQYGRERHIWPKIISSQTAKPTSSQPSPWFKLLAFTDARSSFPLSGLARSYFQTCSCDWGGGRNSEVKGQTWLL